MTNTPPGVEQPAERGVAAVRDPAHDEVGRLLDAAFRVLRRAGWQGFKVETVLREGGISTRAFYRHFPQRADLIQAMFERAVAGEAQFLRTCTELEAYPHAQVSAWIDGAIDLIYSEDFAQEASLFGSEWRAYPDEYTRSLAALAAPLAEVLTSGKAVGAFPPHIRPEQDALATLHVVFGVAAWHSMRGPGRARSRGEANAVARPYVMRALFGSPDS